MKRTVLFPLCTMLIFCIVSCQKDALQEISNDNLALNIDGLDTLHNIFSTELEARANLSTTPTNVNPLTGTMNSTNFKFSVATNPKPSSAMSAQIEFLAPDSKTYSFAMSAANNGFTFARTLSQAGLYKYRYLVKISGQIKVSSWQNITVIASSSSNTSIFSATCLTSASAGCIYAVADNAFKGTLKGQCTWYAYGRVVELANGNLLPKGLVNKFRNALWDKSNRHAKNWPNLLAGTWHKTNHASLPAQFRKKGLLVVWNFGSYGHVAFVESISSDKNTYTVSEFNNPEGYGHRTRTLPFEGNDKLGGVYPQFLDLSSY
jgi:surface antigen